MFYNKFFLTNWGKRLHLDLPGGSVISTGVLGVNCTLMFATFFKKKDAKSSATREVVGGRGSGEEGI